MTKQNKIKELKKQRLTEDIKTLFKYLDDVKLYIIRPLIEKITITHFSRANVLFVYYVNIYALTLYDVYKMELKNEKNERLIKVLKNAEKDVDKFITKYELSDIDMLETEDLPF